MVLHAKHPGWRLCYSAQRRKYAVVDTQSPYSLVGYTVHLGLQVLYLLKNDRTKVFIVWWLVWSTSRNKASLATLNKWRYIAGLKSLSHISLLVDSWSSLQFLPIGRVQDTGRELLKKWLHNMEDPSVQGRLFSGWTRYDLNCCTNPLLSWISLA